MKRLALGLAGLALGCSGSNAGHPGTGGQGVSGGSGGASPPGGSNVTVTVPTAEAQALAAARADLASDRPSNATAFRARWSETYLAKLPYDPMTAQNLDRVQASSAALNATELGMLATNGFVISARQSFPSYFDGYTSLYADHLPLYVSADSIMQAIHRSYDTAVADLEQDMLLPKLLDMLGLMHAALGAGGGAELPDASRADVRADADLVLTTALTLLGQSTSPVAGASATTIASLVQQINAASGEASVDIFGQSRDVDFSQFKPRGHYADSTTLSQYFRAMMWLGRMDLRFLQSDTSAPPTAPQQFFRRQFLDGLLLAELSAGAPLDDWTAMDGLLRGLVGESDNMTVADFSRLQVAANVTTWAALAALPDATLAQALTDGGFGIQRIASQILFVPPGGTGAPLDRVFLLFGQRFVIDSQVFTDVVFDRIMGTPERMMPKPLDVAFAALGNNAAVTSLALDLATFPNYPGALHDARRLVDEHGDDFWGGSLYTLWLEALRGLSPPPGDISHLAGLPAVMRTEPWARRLMNTQLASWAELRHDTLLYAKQSYTAYPLCDFPDAYVDPYPDTWASLVRLAQAGQRLAASVPDPVYSASLGDYFKTVETSMTTLEGMATAELAGQPFTAEQMAFINQTVSLVDQAAGCVIRHVPNGWYPNLFLDPNESAKVDPTIADVHTDPSSGQVLHVATGLPRIMVVTADTCTGPHAYVGLVSSYFEQTTENLTRLDDMQWSAQVMGSPPADVPWMTDLVAH